METGLTTGVHTMNAGTIGAALMLGGIAVFFSPFIIVAFQGMNALIVVIVATILVASGYGLMHGTGN